MKVRSKDFFSSEERTKIRLAVQEAEQNTSGEIAVALVDASDAYHEAELLGAFLLSGLVSLALALAFHFMTIWFFIPTATILFFPSFYLLRLFPHWKLGLLNRRRIDQAVQEKAISTFFLRGVHKTEAQTGILIFISLLERKVWILADSGINSRIKGDLWNSLAKELTTGIKEGRPFEALRTVIDKCGVELTRYFPEKGGGENQLSDDILC